MLDKKSYKGEDFNGYKGAAGGEGYAGIEQYEQNAAELTSYM